MPYPLIPTPPAATPDEPAALYGGRLALALVAEPALTATMTDAQLSLADHALLGLVTADYPDHVRTRLSRLRHLLAATLDHRRQAESDRLVLAQLAAQVAARQASPSDEGGQLAQLVTPPIIRPPAGAFAEPDPAITPF